MTTRNSRHPGQRSRGKPTTIDALSTIYVHPDLAPSLSLDYGANTAEQVSTLISAADTLLAVEGSIIGDFVTEAILQRSAQLLFTVTNHKCTVHLLADAKTVVLQSSEPDLMAFGCIADLLVPMLGSIARVVTLNVEPSVMFKTAGDEADAKESCFLRGLSSKAALAPHVPALAEPNLLTGVAVGSKRRIVLA